MILICYEDFVDILWWSSEIWTIVGVISLHFMVFSKCTSYAPKELWDCIVHPYILPSFRLSFWLHVRCLSPIFSDV